MILHLGSAANEAAPAGYTQAYKDSKVALYYTGNGNPNQAIDEVGAPLKGEKFIRDGQLYIRVGEKMFDAMGRQL